MAVALGSNLGDRRAHLEYAVHRLSTLFSDLQVSTFHDTEPVGVNPQPRFLNGAVVGRTTLPPGALLRELLGIESERGRTRERPGAARTLDLDLILYDDRVISEADLQVPHPRFRERLFVLAPLSEIAPDLIDPVTGLRIDVLLRRARVAGAGAAGGEPGPAGPKSREP